MDADYSHTSVLYPQSRGEKGETENQWEEPPAELLPPHNEAGGCKIKSIVYLSLGKWYICIAIRKKMY